MLGYGCNLGVYMAGTMLTLRELIGDKELTYLAGQGRDHRDQRPRFGRKHLSKCVNGSATIGAKPGQKAKRKSLADDLGLDHDWFDTWVRAQEQPGPTAARFAAANGWRLDERNGRIDAISPASAAIEHTDGRLPTLQTAYDQAGEAGVPGSMITTKVNRHDDPVVDVPLGGPWESTLRAAGWMETAGRSGLRLNVDPQSPAPVARCRILRLVAGVHGGEWYRGAFDARVGQTVRTTIGHARQLLADFPGLFEPADDVSVADVVC